MSEEPHRPFVHRQQVQFVDTDMVGIVHFSNFFRYMEAAEDALLRFVAVPLVQEQAGGPVSFPRLATHCSFLRPIRYPEVVSIEVWIRELGLKKLRYSFRFLVEDRLCAEGEILAICCRMGEKIESIPIPDAIRAKLLPYMLSGTDGGG